MADHTSAAEDPTTRGAVPVATGIVAGVVVFIAVPAVLVVAVGWPVPSHWTGQDIVSRRALLDLLTVTAWLAWACCCRSMLASIAVRVRSGNAGSVDCSTFPDWLATRIAVAVLALTSVGPILSVPAAASGPEMRPAAMSTPRNVGESRGGPIAVSGAPSGNVDGTFDAPVPPMPSLGAQTETGTTSVVPTSHPGPSPASLPTSYTVSAGDSLWSIAERFYHDGDDWALIAQANLGRTMGGGSTFTDPSFLEPGWQLVLPAPGVPTTSLPAAIPAPAPAAIPAPAPAGQATARRPPAQQSVDPRTAAHGDLRPTPDARPTPDPHGHPAREQGPLPLPALAALGTGALAAALVTRRVRRARRSRTRSDLVEPVDWGVGEVAPTDPEEGGTDVTSDGVDGVAVRTRVEAANFLLADALTRCGRADRAPSVQLVRIGPDGVELMLADPVGWAPEPWRRSGPTSWWIPAALGTAHTVNRDAVDPWLPALVALGHDDHGDWFAPVGAGSVLAVLGTGAGDVVWNLRLTAENWSWTDRLTMTDDATVAEMATASAGGPVIFFGDPTELTDATSAHCGIVTTTPSSPADLTLLVADGGLSVHPVGLTLRPYRMVGPDRTVADDTPGPAEPSSDQPRAPLPTTDEPVADDVGIVRSTAPAPSLAPGPVEVRLLTSVPRIEGLSGQLTPKRARRAVELVAYLALHYPDVVTGDRLRTRVLGTAETDAAAKTLFNTVGAVRRALGSSPSGDPYLPLATKSGHYRISGLVTVDAGRAVALVSEADDREPRRAMALLREALSLVEGEPLVGALSGYSWWITEGHERRTAAALVDAACRLARLAGRAGHFDLARWAVERARLVEPYSESLSRAAMEVAAEAGDTDALRHEWEDCRRRADEIDPGGSPAPATEQLYTELRSSWLTAASASQR